MRSRAMGVVLIVLAGLILFWQWPFTSSFTTLSAVQLTQVYTGVLMWLAVVLIIGIALLFTKLVDIHETLEALRFVAPPGTPASATTNYQHLRASEPSKKAYVRITGGTRDCSACGEIVEKGATSCPQCKAVFSTA